MRLIPMTASAALATAALVLAACAGTNPARRSDAVVRPPPVDWTALPDIPDWSEWVKAVRAMEDPAGRGEALLELLEAALAGTGREIHVAGTHSPEAVHPDDYRPVPALNFDVKLNQKTSRKFTVRTKTRSLKNNAGYYFTHNLVPYVVLGPASIDARDPDLLRMYVDHELYHAEHHVGDRRPLVDRELEAWTRQFRHWFYKIHALRQRWGPLVQYYERAGEEEQGKALAALLDYYRRPPTQPPAQYVPVSQVADAQAEFEKWLQRRTADDNTKSTKLIKALAAHLD